MADKDKFVPIKVKPRTKKQITLLAGILEKYEYDIAASLIDALWRDAKRNGLVKDAMLEDVTLPALEAQS